MAGLCTLVRIDRLRANRGVLLEGLEPDVLGEAGLWKQRFESEGRTDSVDLYIRYPDGAEKRYEPTMAPVAQP